MRFHDNSPNEYWSCADLDGSLFLAPDEIRTCCKRFFVDGERRGDVAILQGPAMSEINPETIQMAKHNLIADINSGVPTRCSGCPFLRKTEKPTRERLPIRHLSLEYHSVCNLRCSYCSDTYYGGKSSDYDVLELVSALVDAGDLDECTDVVWGGGEPLMDPNFHEILDRLLELKTRPRIRIFTNAIRFDERIAALLNPNTFRVVTSVDAGTQETWAEIRKRSKLDHVLRNLKRYVQADPTAVTIKYIITEGNYSHAELRAFAKKLAEYDLTKANLQISVDFTQERMSPEQVSAVAILNAEVHQKGVQRVFLDDLVWQRIGKAFQESRLEVREDLRMSHLEGAILDPDEVPEIVIVGTGVILNYMLAHSYFVSQAQKIWLANMPFDGEQSIDMHGNLATLSLDEMLKTKTPIVIAAAQTYPRIYSTLAGLGVSSDRIVGALPL